MNDASKAYQWLEAGKQIGKRFTRTKDNKPYHVSVAIQKCNGVYKLYFDEIEESFIAAHEDYLSEEITDVHYFGQLTALVYQNTGIRISELMPLRGQKIFNPAFS